MSPHVPVTTSEWSYFLGDVSEEQLRRAADDEPARLDGAQSRSLWLGHEPADEEAVRATEERLGVRLPPSYRNFLLVSNGWRDIDPEVEELLAVEEIGWFADEEPHLLAAWTGAGLDDIVEQVGACLLVSGPSATPAYWLLDPSAVASSGEWTAYEWFPGGGDDPAAYPAFGALVATARGVAERAAASGVIERGATSVGREDSSSACDVAAGPAPVRVERLDHLSLTVADQNATIDFYTRVLGVDAAVDRDGRAHLVFGRTRIDLRVAGRDPGRGSESVELCFVVADPVLLLLDRLEEKAVRIEAGPVSEVGALGTIYSIHLRDPDRNLIKLSNYLD